MSYRTVLTELLVQPKELEWPILTYGVTGTPEPKFFTAGGLPMEPPACAPGLIIPREATAEMPYNEPYEMESKILFTFGDWQIECYDDAQPNFNECDWVSHYCEVYGWRYRVDPWRIIGDEICPMCCEKVPEEVMAVWKLKNFDNLPNKSEARDVKQSKVYATSREPEEVLW